MLTKQRHIMHFAGGDDRVIFEPARDEGEPKRVDAVQMSRPDWHDMGEPRTITVTIEPGDLLNEGNGE